MKNRYKQNEMNVKRYNLGITEQVVSDVNYYCSCGGVVLIFAVKLDMSNNI